MVDVRLQIVTLTCIVGIAETKNAAPLPDGLQTRTRLKLAATKKLIAHGIGAEEESVPRQGRCGPSGHG